MQPTNSDIHAVLLRLPIFANVNPDAIATIAAATRERTLQRGDLLFNKGDPAAGFYVVVKGQIKLGFSSAQGDEKVVDILGPNQSFGEAVMFMDRPYPVFAAALVDSLVLRIPREPVFLLLEKDPMFARRMLAGLSMRLHALVQDVESYSLRSGLERVIGFLLQAVGETDPESTGRVEIDLPTSKHVIASRLNLTPESYSRVQHRLIEEGLIAVNGRHVVIHDLRRLREFAG